MSLIKKLNKKKRYEHIWLAHVWFFRLCMESEVYCK